MIFINNIIKSLGIQEDTDGTGMTTDSIERARRTVRFSVEDKPGALWEVIHEFGVC